jgi:NAD(P)-dependent dehydrogenase (short-subunit alcohol dehydrogenase family)
VTEEAGRAAIAAACLDHNGSIDVLVNNAGATATAPLLDYEEAHWEHVFATNVAAAFFMARAVLPAMRDARWGRIVNIGSVYGSLGLNNDYYEGRLPWDTPGDAGPVREVAYSASKGALLQLTRELATAVGRWNVTVQHGHSGDRAGRRHPDVARHQAEARGEDTDATHGHTCRRRGRRSVSRLRRGLIRHRRRTARRRRMVDLVTPSWLET